MSSANRSRKFESGWDVIYYIVHLILVLFFLKLIGLIFLVSYKASDFLGTALGREATSGRDEAVSWADGP
jgi:hypothetical protein